MSAFLFIDLACKNCAPNGKDILIEYKSGAGSVTKETIQKQFIERDLFTANSLEEIQWRLKNTTLTKDKLVGWLNDNINSIINLKKGKIADLLDNDNILNMTDSQAADMFIKYFEKNENYQIIFK